MATVKSKSLQIGIVKRFLNEKALAEFIDSYNEHSYRVKGINKPSDKDIRILKMVREEQSVGLVAKKIGVSTSRVYGAIARASAYKE